MVLGRASDAGDPLVVGGLGQRVVTERAAEQPLVVEPAGRLVRRALVRRAFVRRARAAPSSGGIRQNVRDRAWGAAAAMRVGTGLRASATSIRRR